MTTRMAGTRTSLSEGHEFYNDFNDYTFQVTAPKNFVVWATGDLLNPDDVLSRSSPTG